MIFVLLTTKSVYSQIVGKVCTQSRKPMPGAVIAVNKSIKVTTDSTGSFQLDPPKGECEITVFASGFKYWQKNILYQAKMDLYIELQTISDSLAEVTVIAAQEAPAMLNAIEGYTIYEGKKTEIVDFKSLTANLSTNCARQAFAKIAGLNIWESDGAGLQLGIGGRGLSPNRTANFNTRQNGYDISADALGYPESYYTPPMEALRRVEVVRGAASLQYGTQFGGMVNFLLHNGESFLKDKPNQKIALQSRFTLGSWGFVNTFNSIGAKGKKLDFYGYYQHKRGDGWRENSGFSLNGAYGILRWQVSQRLKISYEHTYMHYLAQQPGGLTDAQFASAPRRSYRERNWFLVDWNLASFSAEYTFSQRTSLQSRTFGLHASRQSLGNLERANVIDFGGKRTLIYGLYQNIGNETRLLHRYSAGKQTHALVLGSRIYQGHTTQKQGDASDSKDPDFRFLNPENPENSSYQFPNRNFSLFLEHIFNLSDKWSLTPGIRFENIQTQSRGHYRTIVRDMAQNIISDITTQDNRNRNRSFVLLGLGASYKPSESIELYANFTQNYRAVTFSDLQIVNPNFKIDPNIQDEKGYNADLGIRGNLKGIFSFDATVFHLFYSGRIGQILKADQPPLYLDYRYRSNISDSRTTGLEATFELDTWKLFAGKKSPTKLALFGNLATINARYTSTGNSALKGRRVELVPEFSFRTGVHFKHKKLAISYYYSYTGQHFTDATNTIRSASGVNGIVPRYQVMDISASLELNRYLKIEATLSNLLNTRYFTRRAEAYPGPGIIPADGRGIYLTVVGQF